MLQFNQKIILGDQSVYSEVTLTLEQRVKARLRVTLDNGEDAGFFVERGSVLRDGDCLQAESGEIVVIRPAKESVSTVYVDDLLALSRACYHLGNRHVALQINKEFVRYQHDHVLDEMLVGLGLHPVSEMAPFEPEPGAYGDHGHASAHSHEKGHSHAK